MAPAKSPWDVRLSAQDREDFTHWLCTEIENAQSARSVPLPEVEYWWTLYEQGLTRSKQAMPWQDAADFTSYIPAEKVDALRSRIMRTIFVDPIWTVEGWGESAGKAPFVEDFHQWQAESEGVQQFLSRVIQASLVETRGVLEVYEDTTIRTVRKPIKAKVQMTPPDLMGMSQPVLDEKFQPILERDDVGNFIEVTDPNIPAADAVIDAPERVRKGPGYRVLPYRNFLVLPSHAKEKADIFGYAKLFTKRYDLLKADSKRGIYDKDACEKLHDNSDVSSERTLSGNAEPVAAQEGVTAEKELWEVQLLHDLGEGLRWYVATIHLPSRTLLRLVHEDHASHRYIIFVPFPRSDKSHEGYSFVGHKLITITEEHTAWRNMLADRASLEISAPVMRQQGALWDPDVQPMGPKAVIDVRDMKEIQPMQIPPAMNGAINREQEILNASERVAGMNDVVTGGTENAGDTTLGELNLRTEMVMVRMEEVIKNLQEPLEDLGQIRQAIWLNVLNDPNASGMMAPKALFDRIPKPQPMSGLDDRGADVASDGKVTADMIAGTFRFKPRGSTESADRAKQRQDFIQFLQALGITFKTWPALMQVIGMNIPAAKSTIEQLLRLFNMPDKQAWIGSPMWDQLGQPMVDPMTGMPMPGAPPMMGAPNNGMPMSPGMPGAPPDPNAPPQGPPNGQ